jgi:HEAT repeat protein
MEALYQNKRPSDPFLILEAIRALGRQGQHGVEPLIEVLKHGYPAAATELGKVGDPRAVTALIDALKTSITSHEQSRTFHGNVISALRQIGDARAVEPLLNVLENSSVPELRTAAAFALEAFGDKRAIGHLIRALSFAAEGDLVVYVQVLHSLVGPDSREAIPALRKAAKHPHRAVYGHAQKALEKIVGVAVDSELRTHLLREVQSGDGWNQLSAALRLAELGDVRAFDVLTSCYAIEYERRGDSIRTTPDSISYRTMAVKALGTLGDARAVPIIRRRLSQPDFPQVEKAAREALTKVSAGRR